MDAGGGSLRQVSRVFETHRVLETHRSFLLGCVRGDDAVIFVLSPRAREEERSSAFGFI